MSLNIFGMKVIVWDVHRTAEWLRDNLFFEEEQSDFGIALRSGNFRIILEQGEATPPDGNMHIGYQHISLETHDINAAIAYCKSKNMNLELGDGGGARFSGKVYGTGMDYFNIITGFGFTIEVSQKLHCKTEPGRHIIWGLEHIGLQVPDLYAAVDEYEKLGFKREFDPVINTPEGHTVICCMVSADAGTVELYEFDDLPELTQEARPAIEVMYVCSDGAEKTVTGTAGEVIIFK